MCFSMRLLTKCIDIPSSAFLLASSQRSIACPIKRCKNYKFYAYLLITVFLETVKRVEAQLHVFLHGIK